jgi:hypothetical protein
MTDTSLDPKIEGRYVLCGNWREWDRIDTKDRIILSHPTAKILVRFDRLGDEAWLSSYRVGDEPETFPERSICLNDAECVVLKALRAKLSDRAWQSQRQEQAIKDVIGYMRVGGDHA